MPNLDGTGPQGNGPMTGRKRGRCRDTKKTDENRDIFYGKRLGGRANADGRFGKGQGRRRGFGRNQTFGN